jgi:hypothetical protein
MPRSAGAPGALKLGCDQALCCRQMRGCGRRPCFTVPGTKADRPLTCARDGLVGTAGFEPATPCSQSRCADQAAPRPVETAADLRLLLLHGLDAASIALQHPPDWRVLCRHVGAKATRRHAHQLRHTFAHAWLAPGWPGDGPHADRWMAVTRDAPAVWGLSGPFGICAILVVRLNRLPPIWMPTAPATLNR